MKNQKIEQLIRNAYSYGIAIGAWEIGQIEKGKPVPENLHEDSIAKLIEDNKETINKLHLILIPDAKIESEIDNLKWQIKDFDIEKIEDKIKFTLYDRGKPVSRVMPMQSAVLFANCIIELSKNK